MKDLNELSAIKEKTLENANLKEGRESGTRVVVGMATCGITAGASPVMDEFSKRVKSRGLDNVTVVKTGCIGFCMLEPIVEVYMPGQEKVTYVKMTPDKVERIVSEHLVGNKPVDEYVIGTSN